MKNKKDENRITRAISLKINYVDLPTANWKEFDKIYDILQKETIVASNAVITACNGYAANDKDKEWLNKKYGHDNIRRVAYSVAREKCKYQYSGAANMISDYIYNSYFGGVNSWESKAKKGEGNPPMSFTSSIPIFIRSDHTDIEVINREKGYYRIMMSFLNPEAKKGIPFKEVYYDDGKRKTRTKTIEIGRGRKDGKISFYINTKKGGNANEIFTRILDPNSSYKMGDAQIKRVERKKKHGKQQGEGRYDYYFLMPYSFKPEETIPLDPDRVMGIDVGVNIPLACSTNFDERKFEKIGNGQVFYKLDEIKDWQSKKKSAIKYNLKNGHGRKYKLDQRNNQSSKRANIQLTYNRNWAAEAIKQCIRWRCGTIHIEDLSGMKQGEKSNVFLAQNWAYYQMQQAIIDAAEPKGIKVLYVNRYQTSQECPRCHCIDKDNRPKEKKGQAYFKCVACGFEGNADHVAAINIAHRDPHDCKKNKFKEEKKEEVS